MNETIINEIKNYMDNPLKYAILLDGFWGSGKTYFIQHNLTEINTIYVSLNGISTIANLSFQLAYQILGNSLAEPKHKCKLHKGNKIVGTVGNLLATHIENKLSISFSDIVKLLENIDFKNKLIILDDLERCNIDLQELLGFINNLVEHNNIKILLVANESELNSNDIYLKIKEKLIYQTLKFIPDLESIYENLIIDDIKEIKDNKSFVINELKRKQHLNIRTLQFIFQRYKELKIILDKILNTLEIDSNISTQIYCDIFKYLVVISRDYKLGENINNFDEQEFSNYQLIESSYISIPSFKFVNDFILGFKLDEQNIKNILDAYISKIRTNAQNQNSSLNILNRWWESEDEEIITISKKILKELQDNIYSFKAYPKLLLYSLRISNAGFSEFTVDTVLSIMKNNIDATNHNISLGYSFLDAAITEEEKKEYDTYKEKLQLYINNHNDTLSQTGLASLRQQTVGNLGKYFFDWIMDNLSTFEKKQKFLDDSNIDNIIYIIENGNNLDVRYLVYLLNEIYNYSNTKTLYPTENESLIKLSTKISSLSTNNFNKMKLFSFNSLIDSINKFINLYN